MKLETEKKIYFPDCYMEVICDHHQTIIEWYDLKIIKTSRMACQLYSTRK
jgi:hypothetical protein